MAGPTSAGAATGALPVGGLPVGALPAGMPSTLTCTGVTLGYGSQPVLADLDLAFPANRITAIIGPSGCGKSTLLRACNRLHELVPGARIAGTIRYRGQDLYAAAVDPMAVRRHIGMVFQTPNPFPRSIRDNVAFGPRLHGRRRSLARVVERSLRQAALWDEVRDHLDAPATSLSTGQQQRLCIARALAMEPDVLLLDEPCSSLDPLATLQIEALLRSLRERYTLVLVTHDLHQAARVSDWTAFLTCDPTDGDRVGRLVEFAPTATLFTRAADPRTEAYITGRFG